MKKLLILVGLFIGFVAYAQNPDYHRYGVRTPYTKYISYTTSQRDALTPTSTDRTIIHHKDTGVNRLEQWDGDSWEELGGDGVVESVQGYIGAVVLDADDIEDTSTTNKFVTSTEKGLIATALQDAPSDGNEYVRKDGDWEVATGGGDNIYTADGTLEGDRSINIAEHSLSVKDSLGMPVMVLGNGGSGILKVEGTVLKGFETQSLSNFDFNTEEFLPSVSMFNVDQFGGDPAYVRLYRNDSTTIVLRAQNFIFNIDGTTPDTGDVLTLQSDGTSKYQAPSGGGATNAENVIVSPAIGGNTDAYAVMDEHETQIAILTPTFTTTAPSQVISLTKIGGTFYTTPEFQDTYTLTGSVDGAFAELAIDTTGESDFPAVTGATLWPGAPFVADEDFSMVVRDIDGTRVYFFLKR